MLVVECSCGKRFSLKDELAGKRIRCPGCSAVIAVPLTNATSDSPTRSEAPSKPGPENSPPRSSERASAAPRDVPPVQEKKRLQSKPVRRPRPADEDNYEYDSWDDPYSEGTQLPPVQGSVSKPRKNSQSAGAKGASPVLWIVAVVLGGGFLLVCGIILLGFVASLANRPSDSDTRIAEFATSGDGAAAAGGRQTLVQARTGFVTNIVSSGEPFGPPDDPFGSEFDLIKYESPAGQLHAYVTRDPGDGRKRPAIVWITGGDCNSIGDVWSPGDPSNDQTASPFRRAGVAMMFPSLRGGNDNPGRREGFLGEVDDVLAAADHLSKLPHIDPTQIYLGGHSTGGTLALLVAECSNRFKAVFSLGPVSLTSHYGGEYVYCDPNNERENALRSPLPWLHCVTSPVYVFEGAPDGNWDSIEMMETANSNPQIHFFKVNGHDHFSIIAPLTERLAAQVNQGMINITADTVRGL